MAAVAGGAYGSLTEAAGLDIERAAGALSVVLVCATLGGLAYVAAAVILRLPEPAALFLRLRAMFRREPA
jgi:hypothetical protein